MTRASDTAFLTQALALARRGEGCTRPNPPVGAVIVRGGRVVGRGYHKRAGAAHAEIEALRHAGTAARGATLYVTLEPCSTQGRTGPCTRAILAAGVRRVVACIPDPNPAHRGRGFAQLRRAGVAVATGMLAEEAASLLAPFARWIATGRPLISLKLGMSLDGRIADRAGHSRWITSPAARRRVQALRRTADAVLVGAGTACADDPSLTCRLCPSLPLWRIIVDTHGRLPPDARVLTEAHPERTLVATTARCPAPREAAYRRAGAQVWRLPLRRGRVSLPALFTRLGRLGLLHVLCEGGGEMAAGLLREGLIDRLYCFVAPRLLGGGGVPAIGGEGWPLANSPSLSWDGAERVGADWLLTAHLWRKTRNPKFEIRKKSEMGNEASGKHGKES